VWLYAGVLAALLSHLLLDYTNNYGIRPFYPFDTHWYAWSIVFIVDPVLLALLGLALVMPWLFGLVGSEVGERRTKYRGRGWAVAALLGMAGWWGLRSVEHASAVQLAQAQSVVAPALLPQQQSGEAEGVAPPDAPPIYLPAQRTLASPDPLTPFRWSAVTDFGPVYRRSEIDSLHGALQTDEILTPKPVQNAAMLAAEASPLGRAYIDWSPMPYIEEQPTPDGGVVVSFRDPRFMGGWLAAHDRSALVGTVREDSHGQVIAQSLDQKVEKQGKE
jgi:inner membrane protein